MSNPCDKIFDHKWLDPACVESGCQSLFLKETREALASVMRQTEADLKSAHAEICKLQGLDPAKHQWPDWTPQANTLRWFRELRERFEIAAP